jgi:hypothetical protein
MVLIQVNHFFLESAFIGVTAVDSTALLRKARLKGWESLELGLVGGWGGGAIIEHLARAGASLGRANDAAYDYLGGGGHAGKALPVLNQALDLAIRDEHALQAQVVRGVVEQQAGDQGVDADRLTGASGAGDEQMRHRRQIGGHGVAGRSAATVQAFRDEVEICCAVQCGVSHRGNFRRVDPALVVRNPCSMAFLCMVFQNGGPR